MGNQVEYELFVFSGIIAWWYFADAAQNSAQAIYNHRAIITKMYFPRIIIPIIPVVVRSFDLGLQLVALFRLMAWFGRAPGQRSLGSSARGTQLGAAGLGRGFPLLGAVDIFPRRSAGARQSISMSACSFAGHLLGSLVPEQYRLLYKILNPTVGPLTNLRAGLFDSMRPTLKVSSPPLQRRSSSWLSASSHSSGSRTVWPSECFERSPVTNYAVRIKGLGKRFVKSEGGAIALCVRCLGVQKSIISGR